MEGSRLKRFLLHALAGWWGATAGAGLALAEEPYRISKTSLEIRIDAHLDESAWAEALELELGYETRPGENIQPPVKTVCLMTYDSESIYVAFRAFDPDPTALRARLADRDSILDDDGVGVKFDTFNGERRAANFFVNPLGVQFDSFEDDLGGGEDESWDVIWESAGRITDQGYVVEFAIPFHQLRFPPSAGEQIWGFDAVRLYPRSESHRLALRPVDRDIDCAICQLAKVRGFEDITPGRNLEIVPTATGGQTDRRDAFPQGPLESGDPDGDLGLSVRWGITPSVTLNATVNPDFSQVEADVAQLAVNTRFTLSFPERRSFFLEGADLFNTPFDAVFTRNVSDPAWGVKLTGKVNKNAFGLFAAQDEVTNLVFPGSQGSDAESFDFESTDAVLRYRRDVGASSALGLLVTSRDGDEFSSQLGGIDGLFRFADSDSIRFQVLASRTEYPSQVALDFDQPTGSFDDDALQLGYDRDARNWELYFRYRDIGENFRADLGFMPQVGTSFVLGGVQRVWWGEEDDWFTRISFGGDWDVTEDSSGQELERESELFLNIDGRRQSYLFLGLAHRERFFNGVSFEEDFVKSYFEVQPTGDLFFGLFVGTGDAIDFANTQPADSLEIEPSLRYNFGIHLKAQLDHTFQRLEVERGRLFEANLSQLRVVYQFNIRTFVRGIFQYRKIERDPSLFVDDVEPLSKGLFSQLLFSYKLNPQSVLFLGYSDSRLGEQDFSLTQENRTLFLKLSYAFVL